MADVFITLLSISIRPISVPLLCQQPGGLQRDSRHRLPSCETILESMPGSIPRIRIADAGPFPIGTFHHQICDRIA